MIPTEVAQSALALPEEDRLELARRLVESIARETDVNSFIAAGVRRIEAVASGQVTPLTEEEFRESLR